MKFGFDTLDKDLSRVTRFEAAQIRAFRPVLWLGIGALLSVAILIIVMSLFGETIHNAGLVAGLIVACWLGLAIGSNDVANSLGPAVGARAIGLVPGLILVAIAEVAGASLAGGEVTHRIANGIFDAQWQISQLQKQTLMLSALIGAALWITVASVAGLPVSTSHSIVGAIAGASIATLGFASVQWAGMLLIATAWIISPVVAGLLAAALLIFVITYVRDAPDRAAAALRWLPFLVGVMTALFLAYLSLLTARRFAFWAMPGVLGVLPLGLLMAWLTRRKLQDEILINPQKPRMKPLFRAPLLLAVVIMGFAHGANDVGNVAGPLSVFLSRADTGEQMSAPVAILLMAGLAIAAGALLFGRQLVAVVGAGITKLNPVRAFCVSLATAAIVLGAAALGLPVSTTHIAIGGVFGVGFAREWLDRKRQKAELPAEVYRRRHLIRRSHVRTITTAWIVTVPFTALLGAGTYLAISLVMWL